MTPEKKSWMVKYNHIDGRKGTVKVTTEIQDSFSFDYGNGKCGLLTVSDLGRYPSHQVYDLRYNNAKDLHMVMIESYFGSGLVEAKEI